MNIVKKTEKVEKKTKNKYLMEDDSEEIQCVINEFENEKESENDQYDDDSQNDQSDNDQDNKFTETREIFNIDAANHILENIDDFELQMSKSTYGIVSDPVSTLKKYVHRAEVENGIGFEKVTYKQNNGKGRFYAIGGLSLQLLCRRVRHTISKEYYKDIDVVNCHPVLLEWLCKQNKFKCKYLSMYIANRNKYIDGNPSKKTLFLIMTNEGSNINEESLTDFEGKYWNEMKKLHKSFSQLYPEDFEAHKKKRIEVHKKDYNHMASFMNTLLCDLENKILMCMWKYYGNTKDVVLCFDGIMIRTRTDDNYKLNECQEFIEKNIGIKITLKIKEMTEGFDLTDRDVKPYNITHETKQKYLKIYRMLKTCINENKIDEKTLSTIFVEMVRGDIIVVNGHGDGYKWNQVTKQWEERCANMLIDEISDENNMMFKALRSIECELDLVIKKSKNDEIKQKNANINLKKAQKIGTFLRTVRHAQNVFFYSRNKLIDEKFKTNIINRKHDLLPILGGKIINLRSGQVRDRVKEDYFSIECPVDFIPVDEWADSDKLDLKKFIEPIFIENAEYIEYMRVKLGSFLCGDISRTIDIFHGAAKNGKSSIFKALCTILGDFVGKIGKDVVVFNSKFPQRKGGGNHTSHLMPIEGKRLIITQELEENDMIDSERVKKIASGDPIEGVRECYGRKTIHIDPFCKLVVATNFIPKFNANDTAIVDRMLFSPFNARFMDSNDEDEMFDKTKFVYYLPDDVFVKKYSMVGRNINILFSWLVGGCMDFYAKHNNGKGINLPDIVKKYIKKKTNDNDYVASWINDECEIIAHDQWTNMTSKDRKKYRTPRSKLCESFDDWAHDNGVIFGKNKFLESLNAKFKCKKTKGIYVFDRIRIISNNNPPVKEFIQNESMIHKSAKNQIIQWFHNCDKGGKIEYMCEVNGKKMLLSFMQEHYFVEYPVVDTKFNSLNKLWPNHSNFKNTLNDDKIYDDNQLCDASPTYEWCVKNELIPEYIFDAAISENGHIVYGIEVVYTNEISDVKKQRIQKSLKNSHCKAVIEISAQWILEQKGVKPKILQLDRFITAKTDIMVKNKNNCNINNSVAISQ